VSIFRQDWLFSTWKLPLDRHSTSVAAGSRTHSTFKASVILKCFRVRGFHLPETVFDDTGWSEKSLLSVTFCYLLCALCTCYL